MSRHHSRRRVSADDLLAELGRLAIQARERTELHRARIELAEALQREMLPRFLPELPGLRAAARYAPARSGLDIGGDWYDGFRLPDGSLGFSVGDVQGHDVEAAAFMGQVRIGLRAVAPFTTDPGEVLSRTNDLLVSMDCGLFATCSFLRFDPATRELLGAGPAMSPSVMGDGRRPRRHPRGRRRRPPGHRVRRDLSGHPSPAARTGSDRPGHGRSAGGTGLPIEAGLEQVLRIVRAGAGGDPDELAARVIEVTDLTGHADDAAVLVLGCTSMTGEQGWAL